MKFRHSITQSDINAQNILRSGVLMKWVSEACETYGQLLSKRLCVIRHIESVDFVSSPKLGEIVVIDASFYKAGKTSLTLKVRASVGEAGDTIAIFNKIILVCLSEERQPVLHQL